MKETVTTTVKLSDVARHAGVSTSTVSRVLNSHPGISNATRLTVLDTLKMLGYKSEAFTNLSPIRDSRTRIDVIICPLAEQKNPMGMNYYSATMKGVREAVDTSRINLELSILSEEQDVLPSREESAGILLAGTPSPVLCDRLEKEKIPFVVLSNNLVSFAGDLVSVNKFTESIRLCDYLVKHGFRRISLLIPMIDAIYCDGFRSCMAQHQIEFSPSDIHLVANTDLASFVVPLHRMLEEERLPEALVVSSYNAANFCVEMLRVKNIRVPEDIRIIAFSDENIPNKPDYITMRHDTVEMGRIAMERLLRKIENPERKSYHIIVPMTLIDLHHTDVQ